MNLMDMGNIELKIIIISGISVMEKKREKEN
jgi:hypothetical protein